MKISSYFRFSEHLRLARKHSGSMLFLSVPPFVGKQMKNLGIPLRESNNLHVTMGYLGKAEDLDGEKRKAICREAASLCKEFPTPELSITGIGHFQPGDEGIPSVALINGKDLSKIRGEIEKRIFPLLDFEQNFGFIPHVTLFYSKSKRGIDVDFSKIKPWKSDTLNFMAADELISKFPFGKAPK